MRVAACDVADRAAVAALLDGVPSEHPLTGVFHAAGVIDDGVVTSIDPAGLDRLLAPKVDAAVQLHDLTAGLDLAAFVLFSSLSGIVGSSGQAGYAAGNTFLDALAQHRRTQGLPGLSLSWGFWETASAMTSHLGDTDMRRMNTIGIGALTAEHGMALFDLALDSAAPHLVPVQLELDRLRGANRIPIPEALRGLVSAPVVARRHAQDVQGVAEQRGLVAELAAMSEKEQEQTLLTLVRTQAAAVLGHRDTEVVTEDRAFKELGFDSLTAVELRNRLSEATGRRFPGTLVFDYPSAAMLAARLRTELCPDSESPGEALLGRLARMEVELGAMAATDEEVRRGARVRLQALLAKLDSLSPGTSDSRHEETDDIQADSLEALLDLVDEELDG
ncbi:KR domain-containing protein [Streptomyces sp. NPDC087850]|uniref:KR domain-containing protein n=1 Tax=Streptomyces sp. NPDC087850 TaxID=3365809 RepID=UPI0037F3FBF9